jgi:hypothetical protein
MLYGSPELISKGEIDLGHDYEMAWYGLFNVISCEVSRIVTGEIGSFGEIVKFWKQEDSPKQPSSQQTCQAFEDIHQVREEDWNKSVCAFPAHVQMHFKQSLYCLKQDIHS